jgi:glutathione peroxidase
MSIYDYEYKTNSGEVIRMDKYKGKVLIVVNTASKCGFTPQYLTLQRLYQDYAPDLEIIAFPCNQFGSQEPGDDSEIKQFCNTMNVTFSIASKVEVNGDNAHPIYKYLKSSAKNNKDIDWNFEKFLIDRDGNITNYRPDFLVTDFIDILEEKLGESEGEK